MGQCLGLVAKAVVPAAATEDEAVDGSALLYPVIMADLSADDSPGEPTCGRPVATMRPEEVKHIEKNRSELVKETVTSQISLERVVDELAQWIPKDKVAYFKVCVSIVLFVLLLFPISFVSSLSFLSPDAPTQWAFTSIIGQFE
jgi:hypothetical protein